MALTWGQVGGFAEHSITFVLESFAFFLNFHVAVGCQPVCAPQLQGKFLFFLL